MKTLRIVVLVGIFGALSSPAAFAGDALTITLNKKAHTPSDTFTAVVTNTSSRTIRYLAMKIEHKQKNGTWLVIRHMTICRCNARCHPAYRHLKPGAKVTETWDYVGGAGKKYCATAATGTYRAAIYVRDRASKKNVLTGKSAPFRFKR
jgi:hypothetical protein